jgi:hypothetical protein
MHVLQWITVQADDRDMAFRTVKDTLESELGNNDYSSNAWFDWFVVGGGRWNPNPDSQYSQEDKSMVISYDEDPKKFLNQVEVSIQSRMEEFNGYRQQFNEKNVDINDKLDNYKGVMNYDFELYPLKKMIDMIQGEWDFNSYFYDMENFSTNPDHMHKSIDLGNKNWYAVPVDFHF